jgi:alkaline phosphatase
VSARARASLLLALALPAPALAQVNRELDPWYQAGREAVALQRTRVPASGTAKNVILFVGDGMGLSTVAAARIFAGQAKGGLGEEHYLSFERLPATALSRTYNTNQQVGESAGTMTAMVTGVKTRAGSLSVDETVETGDFAAAAEHKVPTIFEEAEDRGLSTGVVTTTALTHATPAACYGHTPDRDWESDAALSDAARAAGFRDLAVQLIEFSHGDGIDIALGGGRANFLGANAPDPEDLGKTGVRFDERDLAADWQHARPGRKYVWKRDDFMALDFDATHQVLGLFDPSHLEFEVDRGKDTGGEPSLSEMTERAIQLLSRNPKGYVLMVEGGRIDHAHHAGNAYRALTETVEFANAVQRALELTKSEDTLIVVTADHSQPLTFSGYPTRGNPILGKVVTNGPDGKPAKGPATDALGRTFTTLNYPAGPGSPLPSGQQPAGPKRFPHFAPGFVAGDEKRPDLAAVDTADPDYLQEAMIPLDSGQHAGEDVAIYAGGPGSELFAGVREQNYVYHALVEALGWNKIEERVLDSPPQVEDETIQP